ncbi:methyltransferase domain-containing protein [Paenibacillus spongiae]|nr:methyltransferase domain-containing protein [Paenibacillus spongiae]
MVQWKSLVCIDNNHCFDLSKRGYMNLLSGSYRTMYDKRMFESRRAISRSGVYRPFYEAICDRITAEREVEREPTKVMDAGCGEGSHLHNIQQTIEQHTRNPLVAVGMDISKEGIHQAATEYPKAIWCVGDNANSPFADQSFDYLLNILSPANYAEFRRIMTDDGTVIKVIPGIDYLKELRGLLYDGTDKQLYAKDNKTLERFRAHFERVEAESIHYRLPLDKALIEPLIHMTPLSWGIEEERLQDIQGNNIGEITIDLTILFGKKSSRTSSY